MEDQSQTAGAVVTEAPVFVDGYDALKQMVDGHSSEDVALWLIQAGYWPETLSIGAAAARVRNCLNKNGDQFFKYAEVVFLQWKTGRPYPMFYECDELGFDRPHPRDTMRELLQLKQDVAELEAQLTAKRRRLEAYQKAQGPNAEFDQDGRRLRFSRDTE